MVLAAGDLPDAAYRRTRARRPSGPRQRLVYWTRFFIILTAFSNAQIDAISSKMRDIGDKQFSKVASPNSWTLLDFDRHWSRVTGRQTHKTQAQEQIY
ncbi:hypothetical protein SETIT_7G006700v2 [Setaria italica]|uniref:Uncharacterized protein n=1 Tax=Setaria italica TaxID=4555 RepID=A0A368RQI6_SETIT|nr:protein Iojap, chloroplastic isoform X2 [Setaria italica]RCV32487.1 hypothetical protein SETIT_7G006700v2 [Setaria italica]